MTIAHLNQVELSRRWSISPRTLERWRWTGQGPRFRVEDIEAYEAEQLRTSTLSPEAHARAGAR
jgi:hypothetical protein